MNHLLGKFSHYLSSKYFDAIADAKTKELRQSVDSLKSDNANDLQIWKDCSAELANCIRTKNVKDFLSWRPIQQMMFNHPQDIEFNELSNSDWWDKLKTAIEEDKTGNPPEYKFYKNSSGNLLHHAYSLLQLLENTQIDFKKINNIFEFGGGYGSFCRMMYKYGYKGSYTIYDLPIFNALQKYFLSSLNLPYQIISEKSQLEKQLNLPKVYLLSHLNRNSFIENTNKTDLFIALWSLSEAPIEERKIIMDAIPNPQYYLIAYSEYFFEINNDHYFAGLMDQKKNYKWVKFPIKHLSGSFYLIGERLQSK